MAKDPAFLFYPGDWQGGTSTMSRFIKGCYMDLLIAQFNSGPLSLEEIKTVLGSDFGQSWPTLQKKFKMANGLFFNERLEVEKAKRAEYSKKQKERVGRRWEKQNGIYHGTNAGNTTVIPRAIENENRNEDVIGNGKEVQEENQSASVDELLSTALNEVYLDQEQMKWPHLDFAFELETFRNKVRGSPDEYRNRDSGGIRLAFQYQLRTSKGKPKNGKTSSTNKHQEHTARAAEYIFKTYGSAFGGGPMGSGT